MRQRPGELQGAKKKVAQKKGFWPFSLAGWFYMDRNNATAPKLHGDPKKISWGPNGDLISSEMGTQWGPSTAEMGTQTMYI